MQDYFTKMAADDKFQELSSLSNEMVDLKMIIENILNKFERLNSKIDASKTIKVPSDAISITKIERKVTSPAQHSE